MSTPPTPDNQGRGSRWRRPPTPWTTTDGRPVPPEQLKAISRGTLGIAALVVVTMIVGNIGLPWRMLATLLIVWTVWSTVRLWRGTAKELRRMITPVIMISLFLTLVTAANVGLTALTWPAQWRHQECTEAALTIQAKDQCEQQFEDDIKSGPTGWWSS